MLANEVDACPRAFVEGVAAADRRGKYTARGQFRDLAHADRRRRKRYLAILFDGLRPEGAHPLPKF